MEHEGQERIFQRPRWNHPDGPSQICQKGFKCLPGRISLLGAITLPFFLIWNENVNWGYAVPVLFFTYGMCVCICVWVHVFVICVGRWQVIISFSSSWAACPSHGAATSGLQPPPPPQDPGFWGGWTFGKLWVVSLRERVSMFSVWAEEWNRHWPKRWTVAESYLLINNHSGHFFRLEAPVDFLASLADIVAVWPQSGSVGCGVLTMCMVINSKHELPLSDCKTLCILSDSALLMERALKSILSQRLVL